MLDFLSPSPSGVRSSPLFAFPRVSGIEPVDAAESSLSSYGRPVRLVALISMPPRVAVATPLCAIPAAGLGNPTSTSFLCSVTDWSLRPERDITHTQDRGSPVIDTSLDRLVRPEEKMMSDWSE
jgi:hypothetical protein